MLPSPHIVWLKQSLPPRASAWRWPERVHGARISPKPKHTSGLRRPGSAVAEAGRKSINIERQALDSLFAHQRELEAQLDAAKTQLTYTEIHAPLDGVVLTKNVESGEVVNPGTPVVSIANIDALWMNIYIPETQTGLVKLGQTVRVHVDSFPGETFNGKISFVSSESEFTPKTIQTQEERIKLVYRVKVSLENTGQRLKPGMPADAEILSEISCDDSFHPRRLAKIRIRHCAR